MSIKVSTAVWESSTHKSGDLLLLLAIADHAHDDGTAWPGIARLARMTRLSERHVRRCLTALQRTGEVHVMPGHSPAGGTLYRINLGILTDRDRTAAPTTVTPASITTDVGVVPSIIEPLEETSLETDSHQQRSRRLQKVCSIPPLDEVLCFVSKRTDLDSAVAQIWWHGCRGCGWTDSHGRSIIEWESALVAYSRKWDANQSKRVRSVPQPDFRKKNNPQQKRLQPPRLTSAPKNGF